MKGDSPKTKQCDACAMGFPGNGPSPLRPLHVLEELLVLIHHGRERSLTGSSRAVFCLDACPRHMPEGSAGAADFISDRGTASYLAVSVQRGGLVHDCDEDRERPEFRIAIGMTFESPILHFSPF
jgi:hypothetical protein